MGREVMDVLGLFDRMWDVGNWVYRDFKKRKAATSRNSENRSMLYKYMKPVVPLSEEIFYHLVL